MHLTHAPAFGPRPVVAELRASNGTCFRAGFSVARPDVEVVFGGGVGGADLKSHLSSPSGAFVQ